MHIYKIIKKCKPNNHPEWCGYLQPSEILALFNYIKVDKFHEDYFDIAKTMKAEGKCNPHWVYFYPTKEFLKYTKKDFVK